MLRLAFHYSQTYFLTRYGWKGWSRLIETVTPFFVAITKVLISIFMIPLLTRKTDVGQFFILCLFIFSLKRYLPELLLSSISF
ncbi:hypothetical protein EV194_1014 [Natronoflexus pectinivorans]|uniref:Uncharacterized protein n=1 Tax=Natronoflexus pectinivorans TaxID=682526 RepID=A0A4R2GM73_9BACT|nr:hypothetical protein EV194_1014 [Natronoflexus pectinivorans]